MPLWSLTTNVDGVLETTSPISLDSDVVDINVALDPDEDVLGVVVAPVVVDGAGVDATGVVDVTGVFTTVVGAELSAVLGAVAMKRPAEAPLASKPAASAAVMASCLRRWIFWPRYIVNLRLMSWVFLTTTPLWCSLLK